MKKIGILLFASALLGTSSLKAQVVGEAFYQISFPTGEFHQFVGDPSFLGLGIQFRKYLDNKKFSVGGGFSWFYFSDKKGKETLKLPDDDGTYTGYVTSFTNIYALEALAAYDFVNPDRKSRATPFVQLGLGGAYQNQRQDIGLFAYKYDGIQFMVHGEGGVRIMTRGGSLGLSLTYHYLPGTDELYDTGFFGIRVGHTGFGRR